MGFTRRKGKQHEHAKPRVGRTSSGSVGGGAAASSKQRSAAGGSATVQNAAGTSNGAKESPHLSKETRVRVDAYRKAGAEARAARMATRRGVISGDDGSTATVRDDGTSTPEPRRPTAAAGRGESEAGSPSSPAQLSGASASVSPMDSHSPNAMDSSPGGASTASRDSVKDVLFRGRTRGATVARAAGSQYGLRRRTSQSATSLQPLPAQPGASDDEWRVIEQPTTAGDAATSDGAARVDNDDAGLSPNASPSKGATSAASPPLCSSLWPKTCSGTLSQCSMPTCSRPRGWCAAG